jgi:cytochrome c oxidase cbb3-type subunit 3
MMLLVSRMPPREVLVIAMLVSIAAVSLTAQDGGGAPAQGAAAFPSRPKGNPEAISRGKAAYSTNCAYCHGDDARGGENGGTNLLRSDYLMKDQHGEQLRQFLLNADANGHTAAREGVLKFDFTTEQASDLAAFIHDFRVL